VVPVEGNVRVYNLEVEHHHEYLVGDLDARVHNKCWLDKALDEMGRVRAQIPAWMTRAHGHHIVPKGITWGIAKKLRDLARSHGMTDIRNDVRNLAVAPNGMGTHTRAALEYVYHRLSRATTSTQFFNELQRLKTEMWNRSFYTKLEQWDP
jgi:hypothetical protein